MKYAKILSMKRINNSTYGNPNYEFELQESDLPQAAISGLAHGDHSVEIVTRRTSANIADSYGIIPNEAREGAHMSYEVTKAGRISSVEAVTAGALSE